jgi:hypothetical protein
MPTDEMRSGALMEEPVSVDTPPVVLINARGDLQGRSSDIAFIIESIFAQPEFAAARGEIIAHLSQSALVNHADVIAGTMDFIRRARAGANAARGALLDQLDARLQEHLQEALDSGTAYLSRKRDIRKVFWPKRDDIAKADLLVKRTPLLDRSTPIASAGSCFASNVMNALLKLRFAYLKTEPNDVASASWGLIFNTTSFRQLVEFAFGRRERPRVLFPVKVPPHNPNSGPDGLCYMDPVRESVFFPTVEAYEASYEAHRANCRRAFEECEVFIFTLGMSEVWEYKLDGTAMAMEPKSVPAFLVNQRVLTAQDNVEELERALAILLEHNPRLKLILTVSPVPLHATFRGDDMHVITANGYSKAALRAAADEFCARHPDRVFYFPAYEKIMHGPPETWHDDGRHPTTYAVAQVIELFMRTFLREEAFQEVAAAATAG